MPKNSNDFITVEEASELSGLSLATIRRRCSTGELEAQKVGKQWLVLRSALPEVKPKRRRAKQSTALNLDFEAAIRHVKSTDLSELWVPDVLRYQDRLDEVAALTEQAEDRFNDASYRPAMLIEVPKSLHSNRPGVLLDLPDRIAYQAVVASFAHELEDRLSDGVFSSRLSKGKKYFLEHGPSRWVKFKDAVPKYVETMPGEQWVASADISSYFEHLIHDRLFEELTHAGIGGPALRALRTMLSLWSLVPGIGIPQGPNASRVLGNFYLLEVDQAMKEEGYAYFRYMDDIRIVAGSKESAVSGLRLFERLCRERGLVISSAKTSVKQYCDYQKEDDDSTLDDAAYLFDHASVVQSREALKKIITAALNKETINVRHTRFSLWRLARIREGTVVGQLLRKLELLAPVASAAAAYLKHFVTRGAVERGLVDFLADSSRSYSPFLRTWVYAAMLERSRIPENWRKVAESDTRNRNNANYLRAVAACVMAKARAPRDISWIKRELLTEYDPVILRAYLVALTYGKALDKATTNSVVQVHPEMEAVSHWLKGRRSLPSLVYPGEDIAVT